MVVTVTATVLVPAGALTVIFVADTTVNFALTVPNLTAMPPSLKLCPTWMTLTPAGKETGTGTVLLAPDPLPSPPNWTQPAPDHENIFYDEEN
jgi:hypothetical protein